MDIRAPCSFWSLQAKHSRRSPLVFSRIKIWTSAGLRCFRLRNTEKNYSTYDRELLTTSHSTAMFLQEAFVLMYPSLCAMLCFRSFTVCLIPVVGQQFVKCAKSVYGPRWIKMSSNSAEFVYLVSALGSTNTTTSHQKRSKCQTVDLTMFTLTL